MSSSPSSALRILEYTGSNRIGGVETYLLRLAPFLKKHGHEVVWGTRRSSLFVEELHRRQERVYPIHRGGKFNLLTILRLVRLIRREKIDLIHTHLFSANLTGALAARLCGIPSVARVPALETVARYRYSTYVCAVSKNVARHCAQQGLAPNRLRVFYNGVDIAHFSHLPPRAEARHALQLPPHVLLVACIASLTERKGQRFLLESLPSLPEQVHLVLAGEGNEEASLRVRAKELQLGERVHFLGFCRDVRQVLAASDIFALPSLHEGLPNSVLEAQTAGVPVVSTAIAGTPEVVRDGQTGLLVAPGQVEPLVAALRRFQDEKLRAMLAQGARTMIEREFDGTQCLSRVEIFFRDAVRAWRDGRRHLPSDTSWQDDAVFAPTRREAT